MLAVALVALEVVACSEPAGCDPASALEAVLFSDIALVRLLVMSLKFSFWELKSTITALDVVEDAEVLECPAVAEARDRGSGVEFALGLPTRLGVELLMEDSGDDEGVFW